MISLETFLLNYEDYFSEMTQVQTELLKKSVEKIIEKSINEKLCNLQIEVMDLKKEVLSLKNAIWKGKVSRSAFYY